MVKLEWLDRYSIGIEEIDDDHKNILQIMRNVKKAIKSKDFEHCTSLLDDLVSLATTHFQNEEQYLAESSYPYIEEHIRYHQELLLKISEAKKTCDKVNEPVETEHSFNRMAEFLIEDIIAGDLHFKSYFDSRSVE